MHLGPVRIDADLNLFDAQLAQSARFRFVNHHSVGFDLHVEEQATRVLDQFDIPAPFAKRWDGHMHTATRIATVTPPSAKSGT